jgi:hypothetical protein
MYALLISILTCQFLFYDESWCLLIANGIHLRIHACLQGHLENILKFGIFTFALQI